MIFNMSRRGFESEKERNLYSKFFVGYFFNELINGYESRLEHFSKTVRSPSFKTGNDPIDFPDLSVQGTCVSLDNHNSKKGVQEGEFADVMVHDTINHTLIAIEVKFLDNWDYKKDIVENGQRITEAAKRLDVRVSVPCLLVTGQKWRDSTRKARQRGSNYTKLTRHTRSCAVICWEDLIFEDMNAEVRNYLRFQLRRKTGCSPFV